MKTLLSSITTIINMVSIVLISLAAISLVVSSIMIGIITYISVLERTKEIGILRAIGASKKDIRRVFRAETIIEGFAAGLMGIIIALILILPINLIVGALADIDGIASMSPISAILLIALSVLLNVIAGSKPARMASKKDPVEALRTE
jgi:putative ABC transport system permease protein